MFFGSVKKRKKKKKISKLEWQTAYPSLTNKKRNSTTEKGHNEKHFFSILVILLSQIIPAVLGLGPQITAVHIFICNIKSYNMHAIIIYISIINAYRDYILDIN